MNDGAVVRRRLMDCVGRRQALRTCTWMVLAAGTVAAGAVGVGGCSFGRSMPQIRYYTLTLAPPRASLPAPVTIGLFTADQPYATERLAYRSSPYRLDYYSYHRWAADPRQLIAAATRDYIERAVAGSAAPGATPLLVSGHIRRIEEVDEPDGWHGDLVLDIKVHRGGAVVLERSFSESEPAEARNPEAVAAALSRALERTLNRLIEDLKR